MISRHARVHDFCAMNFAATSTSPFRTRDGVQVLFNAYYHSYCSVHGIHTCYVCEYACLVSDTKIPAVRDCVRVG